MFKKIVFLIMVTVVFVYGCDSLPSLDEVVTDRRNEYRKSEALPDLEVPPDLTTEALNDPLAIPHEEATTLSEYQRRKGLRAGGTASAAGVNPLEDEQWLTLQGSTVDIWSKLKEFWTKQGYTIELDDQELGVLETGWLETTTQGISSFRDKFSVIAESGGEGSTILYITSQRQEKIDTEGEETEWVDIDKNPDFEKQVLSEMNLFFYGTNAPVGTSSLTASVSPAVSTSATVAATPAPAKPKAEILNLGEDKVYLAIPDEFTRAWVTAEEAILKSGMTIQHNDRSKGVYFVLYNPPKEDESVFSKLKFWGDDSQLYQISLTGVGDKTEMVVLDNEGEWIPKDAAERILTYIQIHYNSTIQ